MEDRMGGSRQSDYEVKYLPECFSDHGEEEC